MSKIKRNGNKQQTIIVSRICKKTPCKQ